VVGVGFGIGATGVVGGVVFVVGGVDVFGTGVLAGAAGGVFMGAAVFVGGVFAAGVVVVLPELRLFAENVRL